MASTDRKSNRTRRSTGAKGQAAIEARAAKINALRDRLKAWEGDHTQEDIDAAIALFGASEDGYSDRNCMLIVMQDPQATQVRGTWDWQDVGRQLVVRAPIAILQPAGTYTAEDKAEADPQFGAKAGEQDVTADDGKSKERQRFRIHPVYDIRHTAPVTCQTCGEGIHRVGRESEAQMRERGGRRQATLWTHTGNPKAGHKAERVYVEPAAAPEPVAAAVAPGAEADGADVAAELLDEVM